MYILEQGVAKIMKQQEVNGFKFDITLLRYYLLNLEKRNKR